MSQSVLIKGNKQGFTLYLDPEKDFDTLYRDLIEKFQASASFFKLNRPIALRFEGKELDAQEINQVLRGISEVTTLQIAYVMIEDTILETKLQKAIDEKKKQEEIDRFAALRQREKDARTQAIMEKEESSFHMGTLRSGQSVVSANSVVVVGDVNPGATVSSAKNVVIFGALKGCAYAGAEGDDEAVIVALEMKPIQIRIGNQIARNSDEEEEEKKGLFSRKKKKTETAIEPQMAFVENGQIYIEPVSKSLIKEIAE